MRHFRRVILSSLLLVFCLASPSIALVSTVNEGTNLQVRYLEVQAQDDTTTTEFTVDGAVDQLTNAARAALLQLSGILSVFLTAMNYLLWPVLMMIGALMDNSLILGGGMEDRLLLVWSQIRNIVNLGFVIILVGIAIYNVLGIGEEGNYTIKKILPKFIIALIVVNFTFVGAKVVLDAANVATNAMFALPNSIEDEFNLTKINELERAVCGSLEDMGANLSSSVAGTNSMCADDSHFTANARQFFSKLSSSNIALVMAVNMGQIHKGVDISTLVRQDPTVPNLAINMIFSIVMYVVYASAFIALFIVLLARVVVLWLAIALSPLLVLNIVLPSASGQLEEIQTQFVSHLIAPIKIGFGMTVGYIMLDAYQATSGSSLGITLGQELSAPFSGINSLQQLIIAIAAVAIVWKVTFSAADETVAKGFTSAIQRAVGDTGTKIAKLPLTVPIIPFPDGEDGAVPLLGMQRRLQAPLDAALREAANEGMPGSSETSNADLLRDAGRNNLSADNTAELFSRFDDSTVRRDITIEQLKEIMDRARDGGFAVASQPGFGAAYDAVQSSISDGHGDESISRLSTSTLNNLQEMGEAVTGGSTDTSDSGSSSNNPDQTPAEAPPAPTVAGHIDTARNAISNANSAADEDVEPHLAEAERALEAAEAMSPSDNERTQIQEARGEIEGIREAAEDTDPTPPPTPPTP